MIRLLSLITQSLLASASYLNTKIPYHDKILISYPSIMIGFGILSQHIQWIFMTE
ncbi:hypothetical protein PICMEDRAFT_14100 [Pichia membranifaciens NRRL Y-2026]|uniref:Uncharacterized protein n=1 Tax=Pichia membranifaciens NRRL Y-2026 TaxID=763406 RepID=A0A1E3NR33_9ASCO|nr:hypothetical protein PICMEDRAFT_14100 [Pichia membranifaciens NRRL Y-2026]ODQ48546.1 hypothetical protein PICMEDRAFT_14100 [Pichia membranifaciens NRRL Y-2026]